MSRREKIAAALAIALALALIVVTTNQLAHATASVAWPV